VILPEGERSPAEVEAMDVTALDYEKERILVVDDESGAREPLLEMLARLGFQTGGACNGIEALEALRRRPYTFVLTDMKMPEMDGMELIKHTRKEFPQICIIAMTAYYKGYRYVDVINAGATDFINKPFGIEELEAKVRRAICERNTRLELCRLSSTDALTGLFNQRQFHVRIKEETTRAQRQKHSLALILLDMDDFKSYNDTFGHLAGDELLQKVGGIINSSIREGVDSGYRWGGDEFAILLIDADEVIAREIAERVQNAIKKECGQGASCGYAIFTEGMTPELLVGKADQFLYKFKGQKKGKKVA
jgi:two-component system, cell cycle response regulator